MSNSSKKKNVSKKTAHTMQAGQSAPKDNAFRRNSWIAIAAAIIIFAILVIGQVGNVGNGIKALFSGIFGITSFYIPLAVIYISVRSMIKKNASYTTYKSIQATLLLLVICATAHIIIFGKSGNNVPLSQIFTLDYMGTFFSKYGWLSGGVIGAVLGGLMLAAFDKVLSLIIAIVLAVLFILLVTSFDISDVFAKIKEKHAMKAEAKATAKETKAEKVNSDGLATSKPKFNPDVDMGPGYKKASGKAENPVKAQPVEVSPIVQSDELPGETVDDDIPFDTDDSNAPVIKLDDLIAKIANKNESDIKEKVEAETIVIPEDRLEPADTEYIYPPLALLKSVSSSVNSPDELKENAEKLLDTLRSFGIEARILDISCGPAITRYELQPSAGIKISKIANLSDDIAMGLAAAGVRIEAPIPNKSAIGIEVPNRNINTVSLREIIDTSKFTESDSKLTVALGKNIAGTVMTADLAKMPHLLIAGATGSGKSVCINSFLISLLYKASPDEVKLIMIDPKMVELGDYNGIPHLLIPVVTDPRKAAGALNWAVREMTKRYGIFASHHVKDIKSYNSLCEKTPELLPMARIVIVIDELADLMMVAKSEVEDSICRLAQLARAAGMHLVVATQRPSVNVITGIIKANIPSRIAFAASSFADSKTILDGGGAEKLLGKGDMLFAPIGANKPERIQGCFVSEKEIADVIDFVKSNHTAIYDDNVQQQIEQLSSGDKNNKGAPSEEQQNSSDEKLMAAIEVVVTAGSASTSLLQRKLSLGYARAAKIMDEMEERGIIGPAQGSKPREVLMSRQQWMEMNMHSDDNSLGADNSDFDE